MNDKEIALIVGVVLFFMWRGAATKNATARGGAGKKPGSGRNRLPKGGGWAAGSARGGWSSPVGIVTPVAAGQGITAQ